MSNKITNLEVTQFLENFKETSEIEFLETGKEKNDLINSAKKRGILVEGSRDLGVIKTIYAFTDKPNANGAILPKKEFQRKLPQIVGKPMNVGHNRTFIVGFYIDYKYILQEDKAITYAVFFKSIYSDMWEKAKKFKKKKKLSSSFEIWDRPSKRTYHPDGSYDLNQMELAGGALIFEEHGQEPAFKDAKVLSIARKGISEFIGEECLVCASKYKDDEILVADTDYFKKAVEKNVQKLQEEKKIKETPKVEETKKEVKVEKPNKEEVKPEEKKDEPQSGKIKCSNCQEETDYNGIDVRVKCPKCFAILNKEGVMQYPPQIKDFNVLCPSCNISNWLILSKSDKEARIRCESCSKECKIEFYQPNLEFEKLVKKIDFVYTGSVTCPQCHDSIRISGTSNLRERKIKCPKCMIQFAFDIRHEKYRKISKIEVIPDKIEKSSKGGKQVMEYKVELSKYHRYIDVEDFAKLEKAFIDEGEFTEGEKSARLTTEQRNRLPDSMFAVVVRVRNKRTGEMRKIRKFPINDKAHVRNALARLGQPKPKENLRKMGVSIEAVRRKILLRARQLKMIQLLERHKASELDMSQLPKEIQMCVRTKVKEKMPAPQAVKECWAEFKKRKANKKVKEEAQKKDLERYETENKIAGMEKSLEIRRTGICKAVKKVMTLKKELKSVKENTDKEVKFYKENAQKINERRTELGDFSKELSDKDLMNDDKFEKAQLEKQLAETQTIETASENVGDKVEEADNKYKKLRKQIDSAAYNAVNKRRKNEE